MATMASTFTSKPQRLALFDNFASFFHGTPLAPPSISFQPVMAGSQPSISMSASSSPPYDLKVFTFDPIKESIVSREMTRRYMMDMITYADRRHRRGGGGRGLRGALVRLRAQQEPVRAGRHHRAICQPRWRRMARRPALLGYGCEQTSASLP